MCGMVTMPLTSILGFQKLSVMATDVRGTARIGYWRGASARAADAAIPANAKMTGRTAEYYRAGRQERIETGNNRSAHFLPQGRVDEIVSGLRVFGDVACV